MPPGRARSITDLGWHVAVGAPRPLATDSSAGDELMYRFSARVPKNEAANTRQNVALCDSQRGLPPRGHKGIWEDHHDGCVVF
jgi:hypothetical protein